MLQYIMLGGTLRARVQALVSQRWSGDPDELRTWFALDWHHRRLVQLDFVMQIIV
jgi:hypothetical protein